MKTINADQMRAKLQQFADASSDPDIRDWHLARIHEVRPGFQFSTDQGEWIVGPDHSHRAAVKASTCKICRDGCECVWPEPGCEHYGCWGTDATFSCPEAARLNALLLTR